MPWSFRRRERGLSRSSLTSDKCIRHVIYFRRVISLPPGASCPTRREGAPATIRHSTRSSGPPGVRSRNSFVGLVLSYLDGPTCQRKQAHCPPSQTAQLLQSIELGAKSGDFSLQFAPPPPRGADAAILPASHIACTTKGQGMSRQYEASFQASQAGGEGEPTLPPRLFHADTNGRRNGRRIPLTVRL